MFDAFNFYHIGAGVIAGWLFGPYCENKVKIYWSRFKSIFKW